MILVYTKEAAISLEKTAVLNFLASKGNSKQSSFNKKSNFPSLAINVGECGQHIGLEYNEEAKE